jgi:hypothetical protein
MKQSLLLAALLAVALVGCGKKEEAKPIEAPKVEAPAPAPAPPSDAAKPADTMAPPPADAAKPADGTPPSGDASKDKGAQDKMKSEDAMKK